MKIREAISADAGSVAAIYNSYVTSSIVTFEEVAVTASDIAYRIDAVRSALLPWYLAVEQDAVLAYAYATPWRARSAYRHSVEVTVYLAQGKSGKGIASELYRSLMPALEQRGVHTALAAIALPNDPSIRLHERFGFRKVAHLTQVGYKMDRWIDVGYWQLIFDRTEMPPQHQS